MSHDYCFSPTVDMSGYVPLEKRVKVVQPHFDSTPSQAQARLDDSVNGVKKASNVSGRVFLGLNKKRHRGRVFHRVISGIKRARSRGQRLRFLTLTTPVGYDRSRLSKDTNILRKRVEHVEFSNDNFHRFHMELVKVTTSEGNGVVHAIFKAVQIKRFRQATLNCLPHGRKRKGGSPLKASSELGFIPFAWLKRVWAEIIGADALTREAIRAIVTKSVEENLSKFAILDMQHPEIETEQHIIHEYFKNGTRMHDMFTPLAKTFKLAE